jgi:heme/copper-type cytochrome/quinol oxidase subunit 2
VVLVGNQVKAQDLDLGINYVSGENGLGLSGNNNSDPRQIAVNIVKYLMTFLGIIAVVIILLGGFKWMTAGGNEDKVAEAKKLIIAGCIGLVIVLAAFMIVQFVMRVSNQALNGENISG